jgi:prepilin-type processing-associated H-X9-DG protein
MLIIDIVPEKSIGAISIGMHEADLPKGYSLSGPVGHADGVQFLMIDGSVADVWIEDLRTASHAVRFNGKTLGLTCH